MNFFNLQNSQNFSHQVLTVENQLTIIIIKKWLMVFYVRVNQGKIFFECI